MRSLSRYLWLNITIEWHFHPTSEKFSFLFIIGLHVCTWIASSSIWSLLTVNLPFKVILRMFEVLFWCLEWECRTFSKDWWKFIQTHQTYTMALCTTLKQVYYKNCPNSTFTNKSMVLSLTFFAMISMQCEWLQCNQRLTHLPWLITWWRHPSWSHLPRRESCGHVSLAQLRMRYSYTYTPFYKLSHVQYQHVQTERDEKCKAWFAVTLMYSFWRECSVNLWRFIIVVYLYVQLQLYIHTCMTCILSTVHTVHVLLWVCLIKYKAYC